MKPIQETHTRPIFEPLRKLPRALGYLGAVALVASCGRSGSETKLSPARAKQKRLSDDSDQRIIAGRGWEESRLDFLLPNSGQSPDPALLQAGLRGLEELGPFRLGMTVEEVRRHARAANLFFPQGVARAAWCEPPTSDHPDFGIVIGYPESTYSEACTVNGNCAGYTIRYSPIGTALRLSSIQYRRDNPAKSGSISETKSVEINENILKRLNKDLNTPELKTCEITSQERDLIRKHERFESSILQGFLDNPIPLQNQLPPVVKTAALKWEKSVEVKPHSDCCDQYSLSADFNGAWHIGSAYALSYDVETNGETATVSEHLIVIDSAGRIVWNGDPADFKKTGMRTK